MRGGGNKQQQPFVCHAAAKHRDQKADEHTDKTNLKHALIAQFCGKGASDRPEDQASQRVRGEGVLGNHIGVDAWAIGGVLGKVGDNAVHDGKHTGHGEDGC